MFSIEQVIYIGVQGQGQADSFALILWDQLFDLMDDFINVAEDIQQGSTIYEAQLHLVPAAAGQNVYANFNMYTLNILLLFTVMNTPSLMAMRVEDLLLILQMVVSF